MTLWSIFRSADKNKIPISEKISEGFRSKHQSPYYDLIEWIMPGLWDVIKGLIGFGVI